MSERIEIEAGKTYVVERYPFVKDSYTEYDEKGPSERSTWKPGVHTDQGIDPYYGDWTKLRADGVGQMEMSVVAVFKPGRFPRRVFFTRRFVDPNGRRFGKPKLHIVAEEKFRRLSRGYQFGFEMTASTPLQGEER